MIYVKIDFHGRRRPGLRDWSIKLDGLPWRGPRGRVRRFSSRSTAIDAARQHLTDRGHAWREER